MIVETMTEKPLGVFDRLKAAGAVLTTGKLPNPLASEPADPSRAALVKDLQTWCLETREFWKPVFERIEDDINFAAGRHWPDDYRGSAGDTPYQADVVQRHLQQKESMLYAKKPTFYAERRKRKDFIVWDGTEESIRGAQSIVVQAAAVIEQARNATAIIQQAQQMGMETPESMAAKQALTLVPPDVTGAMAIVNDYEHGMQQKAFEEDFGETLNLLWDYELDAQQPPFKGQMKQLVTRINTCGVGYIKPMFRRETGGDPAADKSRADDLADALRVKAQEIADDPRADSPAAQEMAYLIKQAQTTEEGIDGEQLVIGFPMATSVLIDRRCTNLRGFVGAQRIAEQIVMDADEVERKYGVNLRDSGAKLYNTNEDDQGIVPKEGEEVLNNRTRRVCVWIIWDKVSGMEYTICHGVKDFLTEPSPPQLNWPAFWPVIPVTFHPMEVEENVPEEGVTCIPRSDVTLSRPIQCAINGRRESFKVHSNLNRPRWALGGATTPDDDITKLSAATPAGTVLRLVSLAPGEKISDRLQLIPQAALDPMVYDVSPFMQDFLEVLGTQPANLGAQRKGETATGQAIAEGSRIQSSDSNVDDLEDAMQQLADASRLLLMDNMSEQTVKRIVGNGARWPQLTMRQMRENVMLNIEAGSTGRPNKTLEVQNFQLLGPQLKEMMVAEGRSLEPLIQEGVKRLDDKLDTADFLKPGPAMMQQAMGGGMPGQMPEQGVSPGDVASNVPQAGGTAPAMPPVI